MTLNLPSIILGIFIGILIWVIWKQLKKGPSTEEPENLSTKEVFKPECPATGGKHQWTYERHYLNLAFFTCDKCLVEKHELVSTDELAHLEYEKWHWESTHDRIDKKGGNYGN